MMTFTNKSPCSLVELLIDTGQLLYEEGELESSVPL